MQKRTIDFSRDSTNLFLHILTKCNLSCIHCYINRDEHGENTLDIETIRQWLDLFAGRNREINLVFLGGEPTMHPDLHLAVKHAGKIGFKSITIDTNGYLFHDILNKISCDDIDFLSFSLDGATRKTNDAIRGQGSYDKVISGISAAVKKSFSCSMIYTVSGMNIFELEMMPDLVRDLGVRRFFIQVIGMRGRSSESGDDLRISRDSWLNIIPGVAEETANRGIITTYPKVFLENFEEFECAGNVADNYFVFPNGRVYKCPICEDFPIHSYNIIDNELVSAVNIINERELFKLNIPEGCFMNRIFYPESISYKEDNTPEYKIACCMLKEEISAL